MISRKELLALNFYKSRPFTGSDGNLRYRIEKIQVPQENSEDTLTQLQVTIWPGPFAYATTSDEKKIRHTTDFSEDGLEEITQWINDHSF